MGQFILVWFLGLSGYWLVRGELLQNGDFESMDRWECWNAHCELTNNDKHSGHHSLQISGSFAKISITLDSPGIKRESDKGPFKWPYLRNQYYNGPAQYINVTAGQYYRVSAWAKLLTDHPGQDLAIHMEFTFANNSHTYPEIARHQNAKSSNGWIHLVGDFTAPTTTPQRSRLYFQSGPSQYVSFAVDDASVTAANTSSHVTETDLNRMIDTHRKSNINIHITINPGISEEDVKVQVLQTRKSFPFGTAVSAWQYNSNAADGKYRDFIHTHFSWVVPENALKWGQIEPQRGHKNYQPALDMINGVRSHGLKVRGHNLVWSVDRYVQNWVKELSGDELKAVVREHIEETMNKTRGLLEHWDVNNENLHGQWYQTRLDDPDYNLELFRIAHQADSEVRLFLNDYSVVSQGWSTNDYLIQADRFKAANVGLYGIGAQCHFDNEEEPDPSAITARLNTLAEAGLPVWATELDVAAADENTRADYYDKALRTLYAHPAVEGIMFWGFWNQSHWRGSKAALVEGNNLQLTAAGRRVLDLFENQWMTDETQSLSNGTITVRGFHGDYELRILYQDQEVVNLRETFTLGKEGHSININVHT